MKKIIAIASKEVQSCFKSPIAYIVLVLTITIFNMFFFIIVDESREANLRDVFKVMEFLFIFIAPLLTMKVFAEEKQSGTIEFLMTTPTTNTAITIGKYLGSLAFFTMIMALTSAYYFILKFYSRPDSLAIFIGYLGIWLEGAFFVAIGVMTSSWTRNQIIAAMSSYVILFLLYFSMSFLKYFDGPLEALIRYAGTWSHAENFAAGLVSTTDLVYYFSGIIFCLMLTRLNIENRLWR